MPLRNPPEYATGVNVAEVAIEGWQAWMLLDAAPNGHQRPIALLDEEALARIVEQAAAALARIRNHE